MSTTANAPAGVETKVWASTVGALLAAAALAIVNGVTADSALLGSLPGWAQFVIILAVPPIVAFLSGYAAPHTHRPPVAGTASE